MYRSKVLRNHNTGRCLAQLFGCRAHTSECHVREQRGVSQTLGAALSDFLEPRTTARALRIPSNEVNAAPLPRTQVSSMFFVSHVIKCDRTDWDGKQAFLCSPVEVTMEAVSAFVEAMSSHVPHDDPTSKRGCELTIVQ